MDLSDFDAVNKHYFVNKHQGLYILSARFNHSCMPNVQGYFKGNTIKFKAVYPITKGDELCIFYEFPVSPTKPNTNKVLRSQISSFNCFDCICELCTTNDKRMQKEVENHRIKFWELHEEQNQKMRELEPGSNAVSRMQDILRLGKDIFSEQELGYVVGTRIPHISKEFAYSNQLIAKAR